MGETSWPERCVAMAAALDQAHAHGKAVGLTSEQAYEVSYAYQVDALSRGVSLDVAAVRVAMTRRASGAAWLPLGGSR